MKRRNRIVWKLSAVVIAITTAAIVVFGCVNSIISTRFSLDSARSVLRFNSGSIVHGIDKLMMSRNKEGVADLISDLSFESDVYGDIRLVSHPEGRIIASRDGAAGGVLKQEDAPCARCHGRGDPAAAGMDVVDEVFDRPGGGRSLMVLTPIANKKSCRTAECHTHADSPPVLGFLQADYSLSGVDAVIAGSRTFTVIAVLGTLILSTAALWFLFKRLLARPIENLISGTRRIADNDLDFRFAATSGDEIGLLEESFNSMTARIRDHQSELRSAMEYLEGIVENSADIIITVNPEGLIQTFNRGAEQALGYRREEVVGKRIETLFHDPRERDVAIARLEGTDHVRNYEAKFLTKDGRIRNVLLTISRLRDPEGRPLGTFGISKDITREKRLLRQLVQSERFAAIGQAVTGIQHAIKNMLNALKGGAYLVQRGMARDNRERIAEGWAMVEEGITRITNLSLNMLNYVKEWTLELEPDDLGMLLWKLCDLVRQSAADKGITLKAEIPDPPPPPVVCDHRLIHMAMMDIVSNAVDACTWRDYAAGERASVLVGLASDRGGEEAVITVRDNGCGMSEEIRKNIFTPFFSTKKKWGTGLGLALTMRIIKLHGGSIKVESQPDRGTTFRIVLPVGGPEQNKESADGQEGSRN